MGVLDLVRGRDQAAFRDDKLPQVGSESETDSDQLSLEARNEKEVQAHPGQVTSDAQIGVQKAEAAALVWSKKAVYLTYAWIWVCFFMLAFQSSILFTVSYTAYSAFNQAPAYTQAAVLSSIIGGVLKLPIAKILNLWGRAEGYLVFLAVYLIGIIILAAADSPDTYAAGYVLYWIGYDAVYLILDIFVADTSGLRKRAFTWAFASTPFICTAFTGPLAAQAFLAPGGGGWRWAIGTFAIVNFVAMAPLAIVFKFYQRKAEKMGLFKRHQSGRSTWQSIVHYFHEFDIIGACLIIAAFVLFLLPFSLNASGWAPYDSATFISMIVIGVFLFPVFYAWERYGARTHFVRWELLRERTVLGACATALTLYFSFYCWDTNYYNYVKVVYALSVSDAGYMAQIWNVGSCFWGVVFGVWVYYTKHFKYTCLLFGVPLFTLGAGLMIHFRGNDSAIGYLIMCQIFIAFGGGTVVIGNQMAVMSSADRDGVPMLLSILSLFNNVGGAIGGTVVAAVYANTFKPALSSRLPPDLQGMADTLYFGGVSVQESYVPGTPERIATNYAWGRTQFYGCIAATAIMVLAFAGVACWKDYNVDKKQNKGTVI